MSHNGSQFFAGAALGGLIIGGAAYFFNTKEGTKLKRKVQKQYEEYRGRLEGFIDTLDERIEDETDEKTEALTKKARNALESLREEMDDFWQAGAEDMTKGLILGGILGSLAGAGASYAFSSDSNPSFSMKHFLQDVVDTATKSQNGEHSKDPMRNTLELALTGIRLWQSLKK